MGHPDPAIAHSLPDQSRLELAAAGQVLDGLSVAILIFDPQLRIRYRNQAAGKLLPGHAHAGRMLDQHAAAGVADGWAEALQRCLRQGGRFEHVALSGVDRPAVLVNLNCTPLLEPATGGIMGGILTVEDVTAQADLTRRLAAAERLAAVGKLAARVAHELNNPLDGILRYLNLAGRVMTRSPAAADRYLAEARTGLARMIRIVAQLLEFSRGAQPPAEQGQVNKVVDEALRSLDDQARAAGVTVVCNYDESVAYEPAGDLYQVFRNLIKNAIDAMPEGGMLTVTTRAARGQLQVIFEDTGVGLPPNAERIFDAFFTTKPAGKGTGLGLAICREMVERYRGSITAAGRQPRGAVFTVTVPLGSCSGPAGGAARSPAPAP